ncbi:hypothetical protein ScPMuIL_005457 [Solemya velum]
MSSVDVSPILLVSLLRIGCGNTATIHRISAYLEEAGFTCLLRDPSAFKNSDDFLHFLSNNKVKACIGLHAYRSGLFLRESPVPYVLMLGGTDLNEFYKEEEKFKVMTEAVKNARFLVAFNKSLFGRALELWPDLNPRKIWRIPQAVTVSPSAFSLLSYLENKGDISQIQTENIKIFLFMGSIRSVKDPFYLLSVFSEWHRQDPSIYYVLVGQEGESNYYQVFLKTIDSLPGIIHIKGLPLEDAHTAIRDCFALVNSSVSEGMPLAVLEAMKLKTPVIARGNHGNRDIIKNGVTGFLFNSPEECMEEANRLLSDTALRNKIINSCERKIETSHSLKTEGTRYLSLVRQLLRPSPSTSSRPLVSMETRSILHKVPEHTSTPKRTYREMSGVDADKIYVNMPC